MVCRLPSDRGRWDTDASNTFATREEAAAELPRLAAVMDCDPARHKNKRPR